MFMKNLLLFVLLLLLNACSSKYFEGTIKYQTEYTEVRPPMTVEMMKEQNGEQAALHFKKGNYKEIYNSGEMKSQLFLKKDSKVYWESAYENNTFYWSKTDVLNEEILDYAITKNKETILGIPCDELMIKTNKGEKYFYYSSAYPIKAKWYEGFKDSHKAFSAEKMGAMYLKYIGKNKFFTVEVTATEVKKEKISKNIFKLPTNAKLVNDE